MTKQWTAEFRLSITRALADQLETTLRPLEPAPLTLAYLSGVAGRPGVYTLYLNGQRVYVGKAATSLQERLTQHHRKLCGRTGIASDTVRFICAYVDEDLDAAAPEKLLIKRYREHDSIPWNTNGFGNNDPGRNRDKSVVKAAHFDALYPINLDYRILLGPGSQRIGAILDEATRQLPYRLRFDKSTGAQKIYQSTSLTSPGQPISIRNLAPQLIAALPEGWQLTALPGYLIMYQERQQYDSALGWWRREPDGQITYTLGPRQFAGGKVDPDFADEDAGESDPLVGLHE
ncbi:GIY-YIG nuclease family protein [Micromonospora endophytica]|uniref:GIY-YIG nuclease family protein n=1 Tax=Micromonospora endophytica TaxID=515350 RepID=UPI0015E8E053|nr:GIY-YIG nuclease family protein [Micromonospora endophytica]BCJ58334.1 hypothetical protein Jiend_17560 [Micromonospora endophytica]